MTGGNDIMICPRCNRENNNTNNVCYNCGLPLRIAPFMQPQAPMCPNCHNFINIKDKKCRVCNYKIKKKSRVLNIILVSIIMIIAIALVCSVFDYASIKEKSMGNLSAEGRIKYKTNNDIGSVTITGKVVNHSNKSYSYVQITFGLYNSSGEKVGIAIANTLNLSSGETWSYEAVGIAKNVTRVKVEELTGH